MNQLLTAAEHLHSHPGGRLIGFGFLPTFRFNVQLESVQVCVCVCGLSCTCGEVIQLETPHLTIPHSLPFSSLILLHSASPLTHSPPNSLQADLQTSGIKGPAGVNHSRPTRGYIHTTDADQLLGEEEKKRRGTNVLYHVRPHKSLQRKADVSLSRSKLSSSELLVSQVNRKAVLPPS